MGVTIKTSLLQLGRQLLFVLFRGEAEGLEEKLLGPIREAVQTVAAVREEGVTIDRSLLRTRAFLNKRDADTDDLVYQLADLCRLSDRTNPSGRLMELFFGAKAPHELIIPSGTGLGRELDAIDLLVRKGANLPDGPAAEQIRKHLERMTANQAAARQSLADALEVINQRKVWSTKVLQTKHVALEALDRIRGELTALFPRNRDLVNSFFLPADVSHSPEEEPAPEPPAKAEGGK